MTALESQAMAEPQARLDLGRVVGRTFSAIGGNFLTFFLLTLLLSAAPNFLLRLGFGYLSPFVFGGADSATIGLRVWLVSIGMAAVGMIPTYVLFGALTQGSFVHYSGGKASFGECLGVGLRFLPSLVGLGIASVVGAFLWALPVFLVGAMLGGVLSMLLVQTGNFVASAILGILVGLTGFIPVILAVVRWSVAASSLVVERTGIMGAFRRSGALTRRNRWAIFFLVLIWIVMSIGIQWAITFVGTSAVLAMENRGLAALVLFGVGLLYSALTALILAAGQAGLYYELRVLKDGATSEELAKIFE